MRVFVPTLLLFFLGIVAGGDVVRKNGETFELVGVGNVTVRAEKSFFGFRFKKGKTCSFKLKFEGKDRLLTSLHVDVSGNEVTLMPNSLSFGNSDSMDILLATDGSLYRDATLLKASLEPLKIDKNGGVLINVLKVTPGCSVPIVKGTVIDEERNEKNGGGVPLWLIVLLAVLFGVCIVIMVILIVICRKKIFRRNSALAQPAPAVSVPPPSSILVPQPEAEAKEAKIAVKKTTAPKPKKRRTASAPPPTQTKTDPTQTPTPTPTVAPPPSTLPPATVPSASTEPPSLVPPPPSATPPASDEPPPRFTKRGVRVHRSVPQHLIDNPTPQTSRSSERKKRKMRKNSLEEGNRPPGYRPPPPPPPPKAPIEHPAPSTDTEEGKKRCCPEQETPPPTPAVYRELPPTKRLPQTEYLNFTPSDGSPHPSHDETKDKISTDAVGQKRKSARDPAKNEAKPKREAKTGEEKPKVTVSKPKRKNKSSEEKGVNHAIDDDDDKK